MSTGYQEMISKIASTPPVAATNVSPPPTESSSGAGNNSDKPAHPAARAPREPKPAQPPAEPLLRLEIKDDGQGRYVYTLSDRFTGRTVVEIPREGLAQLGSDVDYNAGDVVSTKA